MQSTIRTLSRRLISPSAMPLSQALPPYTSMPISYLERSIKGAITIPMRSASWANKVTGKAAYATVNANPGDARGGGKSPSELHQASVEHTRWILEPFKKASDGWTFVECTMSPISDITISQNRIRADSICLLELHQHGQRLPNPNFILATNTNLTGNSEGLRDIAFTKMMYVLCDEIENAMPRGSQCAGIVVIGTEITFYSIVPAGDQRGCFVSALSPSQDGAQPHSTEPILVPPGAWR